MAVPTSIQTLLSGNVVEWARIEFKETWDGAASLKTVCAFANDIDNWGGGYIVIGVKEENGIPVRPLQGVPAEKVDEYLKDMTEKFHLIRPAYMPVTEVVDYVNKKFIVAWCPGGDVRPYASPKTMGKDNKEKIYYIRKNSSTIEPNDDMLKDLFTLANKVPFDDRVNHNAELADLNPALIQNYLREVNSSLYEQSANMEFTELCRNMNIVSVLPEYVKPKNVGLMFFSLNPEKFFPYTQIDVVQFPDGLGGDNIIEHSFLGPIHQQLREALQYIKNVIIEERIIKYPDRAEVDRIYNYPFAALEEALSNAVYHRGYDEREPIEVRVESDQIEIVSFPGPDHSVTMEGLKNYRVSNRRYRNRRIGDFLKELHLTEGRNTGFRKMLKAIEANGSPKPEFETDDSHSYFISRFFIHEGFEEVIAALEETGMETKKTSKEIEKTSKEIEKTSKEIDETSKEIEKTSKEIDETSKEIEKTSKEIIEKGFGMFEDENKSTSRRIVDLLKENPYITAKELAELTSMSVGGVNYQLEKMKREGKIYRKGATKKGKWIVA